MRKRGGNDRVNGGSELRGLEVGWVGKKGRLRTMGAGLCKPVAGYTAPRIAAVGLKRGHASTAYFSSTLTQALVKQPVLVRPTSHERQNEIGQNWQDGQPGLPCSL